MAPATPKDPARMRPQGTRQRPLLITKMMKLEMPCPGQPPVGEARRCLSSIGRRSGRHGFPRLNRLARGPAVRRTIHTQENPQPCPRRTFRPDDWVGLTARDRRRG